MKKRKEENGDIYIKEEKEEEERIKFFEIIIVSYIYTFGTE